MIWCWWINYDVKIYFLKHHNHFFICKTKSKFNQNKNYYYSFPVGGDSDNVELVPNIILNPGYADSDDKNYRYIYKRSMLYDATYNSDDDEPMTLKRKILYFFTGDSIKRLWDEQNKLQYDVAKKNKTDYRADNFDRHCNDFAVNLNRKNCWNKLVKNNKILINVVDALSKCIGCTMTCEIVRIVPASLSFLEDDEAFCMKM